MSYRQVVERVDKHRLRREPAIEHELVGVIRFHALPCVGFEQVEEIGINCPVEQIVPDQHHPGVETREARLLVGVNGLKAGPIASFADQGRFVGRGDERLRTTEKLFEIARDHGVAVEKQHLVVPGQGKALQRAKAKPPCAQLGTGVAQGVDPSQQFVGRSTKFRWTCRPDQCASIVREIGRDHHGFAGEPPVRLAKRRERNRTA